jgi:arsenate reductase
MKKLYHLSTCNTCQRIIRELHLPQEVVLQDIKSEPISKEQLEEMQELAGSYEALFSKRARLYKALDLKNKSLKEDDYKTHILEHYTFLKRPVLIYDGSIFIGNSKKVVEAAKVAIHAK